MENIEINKTPKIYVLVGLPASGKSTLVSKMTKTDSSIKVHSSDALRKELFGDETIQEDSEKIFEILTARIISDLKCGEDVIYDATNLRKRYRAYFLKKLENCDCKKVCLFLNTPLNECLKRNEKRQRQVPSCEIIKMNDRLNVPTIEEGFDKIIKIDNINITTGFNFDEIIK